MEEVKKEVAPNEVDETELNEEELENVNGGLISLLEPTNDHKISPSSPLGNGLLLPAVQKIK
jgi:bacteriocin-like protein